VLGGAARAAESDAELANAAMQRDPSAVRALLARDAEVNATQPDGATALHWAAHWDDLEMAQLLVRAGADPSAANRFGVTPLELACINGSASMIELLLTAGVDPNAPLSERGEMPLMMAARTGSERAVEVLIARGAAVDATELAMGQTALMWAAAAGHTDIVRLLIANGADVNARSRIDPAKPRAGDNYGPDNPSPLMGGFTALVLASRENHVETVEALLGAGAELDVTTADGTSALHVAVLNAHFDLAADLLERGADPNLADARGRTPLFVAVDLRNLDVTEVPGPPLDDAESLQLIARLLERGADPNVTIKAKLPYRGGLNPGWLQIEGATPFYRAAAAGDIAVMRLVLENGADPSINASDGTTPLMVVAGVGWLPGISATRPESEMLAALELCMEQGAAVNATNLAGLTALHGAAFKGWNAGVRALVDRGAALDAADAQGRLPMHWAEGVSLNALPAQRRDDTVRLLSDMMREAAVGERDGA
jgi:ankyrin repeat protein